MMYFGLYGSHKWDSSPEEALGSGITQGKSHRDLHWIFLCRLIADEIYIRGKLYREEKSK